MFAADEHGKLVETMLCGAEVRDKIELAIEPDPSRRPVQIEHQRTVSPVVVAHRETALSPVSRWSTSVSGMFRLRF